MPAPRRVGRIAWLKLTVPGAPCLTVRPRRSLQC